MTKLIIIAGPQSSGKTTIFNLLKDNCSFFGGDQAGNFHFVSEINPYTLSGKTHPGAAFTGKELELSIIKKDLENLKALKPLCHDRNKVVVMETGIFQLVYGEFFGGQKLAKQFLKPYLKLHQSFDPYIFFIDTKPEISWKRRRQIYLQRIKKRKVKNFIETTKLLEKYQNTIYALYPLWQKYYRLFPFKKIIVYNSFIPYKQFIDRALTQFQNFL